MTQVTRDDQSVETIAYDPTFSVPTSITDFDGLTTTFTLDPHGNVLRRTDPDLSHVDFTYNTAGQVLTATDANGHTTTYSYDTLDRLSTITDPGATSPSVQFTYDTAGNIKTLTDPDGNVTTYDYDNANRVLTATDPRAKTTTNVYDPAGNLTQTTDRDGRVVQYAYDPENRLTTETWVNPQPGGPPLDVITTTYDPAGRINSLSDNYSHYVYGYDAANRLTSVDNLGTPNVPHVVLTYTYDPAGNRLSVSDNLGGVTNYSYNDLDELTTLTQSGTGVAPKRIDFTYGGDGQPTSQTRYSDVAGTQEVMATLEAYDPYNHLTGITHQAADGFSVIAAYDYTLDPAQRLTEETRTWSGGSSTDTLDYGYTDDNQLTTVTHTNGAFAPETFGYDPAGNRNTAGYTTATGNRLTSNGTYNYGYDDEGNLTSRTEISTGNQLLFTWDDRNRLTEVDQVIGGVRSTLATYAYDVLDRRIGVVAGGTATWTVYDGSAPLLDFNGAGAQTARYLDGPSAAGVDAVLARETPTGGVAWYLSDQLGTIRDLVDNTGAVLDHVDYGTYGAKLGETNPSQGDRFGFAGMQTDPITHLYFDQARWYDPVGGRFLSIDPLGFGGGDTDLYRYVGNDPSNLNDPTGLDVRIENTDTAGGWHQRITVDCPGGGTYSISFGVDGNQPGSSSQGSNSSGSAPGRGGGGSGIVYVDDDPPTQTAATLPTTPEEDAQIQNYLKSLVDNRGKYSLPFYNCRSFSRDQFNKIRNKYKNPNNYWKYGEPGR